MIKVTAELTDDQRHVIVKFPFDARLVERMRRVPTRKWQANPNGPGGHNTLLADLTVMRRLREEMGSSLVLGPKLKAWGHEQLSVERNLRDMALAKDARLKRVPNKLIWKGPTGEKKKLKPYQRADIKVMSERNMVNANQPGAGKTAEVILALAEADLLHGFHLVNAPVASLRLIWQMEIEALYAALDADPPTILTGDGPSFRRAAIEEAEELYKDGYSFWLLINPALIRASHVETAFLEGEEVEDIAKLDGLQQMQIKYETEWIMREPGLLRIDWTSFSIDEYHLMGLANPSTQGHQGCKAIKSYRKPARSYVLSGTPIRGKPIKLHGALQFLYPEEFSNKMDWANQWLNVERPENRDDGATYIGGIKPGKEEEFATVHAQVMVRRTTREALPGMPRKQPIDVWCDMSKKQQDQYRQFEAEAEWRLDEYGPRLSATNILAEYTRLRQFANAYCEVVELDNGKLRVLQTPDSGKLEQLLEHMGEEGSLEKDDPAPTLVFSQFNPMVDMIATALETKGLRVGIINGPNKKYATERGSMFQASELDVLVMNTLSGVALNLARAESVHLLDETWVPDDQEQAEDRALGGHRAIGKKDGRCYYYRTRRSIDEHIKSVNEGKAWNNKMTLDLRRRVQRTVSGSKR